MKAEYAVVLIKPDAVRDILEEMIIRDLRVGAGIRVIFRKYWHIKRHITPLIYPDWVDKLEFPAMTNNLMQGPLLFLVVERHGDVYASLRETKGKMNQGGLRLKYRTRSIEEWQALGYSGQALRDKIAENRLHTTDNLAETVSLCSLAMRSSDIEEICTVAPVLGNLIRRKRMLCVL